MGDINMKITYSYKNTDPRYRNPIDISIPQIETFLKNEIIFTKVCSCDCCNYKRHMLRALQEIVKEKKYSKDDK